MGAWRVPVGGRGSSPLVNGFQSFPQRQGGDPGAPDSRPSAWRCQLRLQPGPDRRHRAAPQAWALRVRATTHRIARLPSQTVRAGLSATGLRWLDLSCVGWLRRFFSELLRLCRPQLPTEPTLLPGELMPAGRGDRFRPPHTLLRSLWESLAGRTDPPRRLRRSAWGNGCAVPLGAPAAPSGLAAGCAPLASTGGEASCAPPDRGTARVYLPGNRC